MRSICCKYGQPELLQEKDISSFMEKSSRLLQCLIDTEREEALQKIRSSERYSYYEDLVPKAFNVAEYLCLSSTYRIKSLVSQCRLNYNYINFNTSPQEFKGTCEICGSLDSFKHVLLECKPVGVLHRLRINSNEEWWRRFNLASVEELNKLYYCISGGLFLRGSLLVEFRDFDKSS